MYYSIARAVVVPTRVARMPVSQGCHPRRVFDFIYIILDIIATCMQNFKKIYRKKNRKLFIWKFGALFLGQTVHDPCVIRHCIDYLITYVSLSLWETFFNGIISFRGSAVTTVRVYESIFTWQIVTLAKQEEIAGICTQCNDERNNIPYSI